MKLLITASKTEELVPVLVSSLPPPTKTRKFHMKNILI